MFEKAVVILNNGKKLKIKKKNIKISDLNIEFSIDLKYYGYFSTAETSLKEGYFKKIFSKSRSFLFDLDIIPAYRVENGKLIIQAQLEEI